jgi:hypothetical protein
MCAPIEGRIGPVGAHPKGGTARTLAGSVRYDEIDYTRSRVLAYSRVHWRPRRTQYTDASRFPEPCGHPGLQPSPKHILEGCMVPNESTVGVAVSTGGHAAVAMVPDSGFDARWDAWRARGMAHERAVRRKLTLIAGLTSIVATAVAIAYALLRP